MSKNALLPQLSSSKLKRKQGFKVSQTVQEKRNLRFASLSSDPSKVLPAYMDDGLEQPSETLPGDLDDALKDVHYMATRTQLTLDAHANLMSRLRGKNCEQQTEIIQNLSISSQEKARLFCSYVAAKHQCQEATESNNRQLYGLGPDDMTRLFFDVYGKKGAELEAVLEQLPVTVAQRSALHNVYVGRPSFDGIKSMPPQIDVKEKHPPPLSVSASLGLFRLVVNGQHTDVVLESKDEKTLRTAIQTVDHGVGKHLIDLLTLLFNDIKTLSICPITSLGVEDSLLRQPLWNRV